MRKYTTEIVREIFLEHGYTLLSDKYMNNKQRLKFICPNHVDKTQTTRLNDLLSGHGCRDCGEERKIANMRKLAKGQRLDPGAVRKHFEDRGFELVTEYVKNDIKLIYFCPKHPCEILRSRFNDFKESVFGCKFCAIDNSKLSIDEVRHEFQQRGYVLLEDEYKNSATKLSYVCSKHPEEKQSITVSGLKGGHGCGKCAIERISGKFHYKYNASIPHFQRVSDRRYDDQHHRWRKRIFTRDSYKCVVCGGGRSGKLNAHHLDGYNWAADKRYDDENGVTLCVECHKDFHSKYGYGNNTKEQYDSWLIGKSKRGTKK